MVLGQQVNSTEHLTLDDRTCLVQARFQLESWSCELVKVQEGYEGKHGYETPLKSQRSGVTSRLFPFTLWDPRINIP